MLNGLTKATWVWGSGIPYLLSSFEEEIIVKFQEEKLVIEDDIITKDGLQVEDVINNELGLQGKIFSSNLTYFLIIMSLDLC